MNYVNKFKLRDFKMEYVKKVLLLNPNSTVEKDCIRRLVTPLGLLYIGAVLEEGGHEVSILDSPCEGYDNVEVHGDYVTYGLSDYQIKERIKKEDPDAVGVACSFSFDEKKVYDMCKLIKSVNENIIVFVGGIHPSLFPKKTLLECKEIDFVVMKEGEYRTLKFFNAINSKKNYEEQDGIAFRKNGKVRTNPPTSFIKNIDELPHPARHLIDMEKYIRIGRPPNPFSRKERVERIFTSRGCPFNCCFCAGSRYWGNIRMRSVDNVIEEMRILKNEYNIQEIQFSDDNMTVNKKRVIDLFKRMKEEFDFAWCTPSGVLMSTLDEEMIKAMAESGCYQLTLSPESGSQRVLDEIIHGKPINLKTVKPIVALCHKYGIDTHSNFIVGLPGETREELMQTFDFAKEVGFDSAAFFIAVPYAGTELYETCKARGWLKEDTTTADFKHANIVIGKHEKEYVMSGEELEKLVDAKTKEFNEWSKKRNPDKWNKKFNLFLKRHKDEANKITGRVV